MANNTMILSARGAFYQVSLADTASGASKSFYAIDNLTINPDETAPQSPILITGVRYRTGDIVGKVLCLNNFKVYYSFGQNFGDIAISGEVLLGPLGGIKTDGVDRLLNFFWKYRVSIYHKPIVVHIVDKAYNMYLEGIQILDVDSNLHILPFALIGTQIDPSRDGSSLVNPSAVVLADVDLDNRSLAAALTVNPNVTQNAALAAAALGTESPDTTSTLTAAQNAVFNNTTSSSPTAANAQIPPSSQAAGSNPTSSLATPPPAANSAAGIIAQQPGGVPSTPAQQASVQAAQAAAAANQNLTNSQSADAAAAVAAGVPVSGYVSPNTMAAQAAADAAMQKSADANAVVVSQQQQQTNQVSTLAGPTNNVDAQILARQNANLLPTNSQVDYQAADVAVKQQQAIVADHTANDSLTDADTAALNTAIANRDHYANIAAAHP